MPDQRPAQKICFVIGPIGDPGTSIRTHADWLLEGIIKPTFDAHFSDWTVLRSDKISKPGMIDSQIIDMLMNSDLVIADMSFENANAFYEMGIRHVIQKPIIHMFLEGSNIPFDVKLHRAIPFSILEHRHLANAQSYLNAAVKEAILPDFKVENPVTIAFGRVEFAKNATEAEKIIEADLQEHSRRLNNLETFVRRLETSRVPTNSVPSPHLIPLNPLLTDDIAYRASIIITIRDGAFADSEDMSRAVFDIIRRLIAPKFKETSTTAASREWSVNIESDGPFSVTDLEKTAKDILAEPDVVGVNYVRHYNI